MYSCPIGPQAQSAMARRMQQRLPPTPPPDPGGLSMSGWAGVAALLILHVGLALWSVSHKSVTADEILHLTGGFFYDRYGDYRTQPENGNLPQRVAGLPAALSGAKP